jgi:hypothetical protein
MGPLEIKAAVEATRRAAQRAGLDPESVDKALGEIGAAAVKGGGIFELWSAINRIWGGPPAVTDVRGKSRRRWLWASCGRANTSRVKTSLETRSNGTARQ